MAVYNSSLLYDEHQCGVALDGEMQNFDTTLAAMVDPMLEMCRRMAALRENGGKWETAIFMINCLTYLQVSCNLICCTCPGVITTAGYPPRIFLYRNQGIRA
jgi:hypothetical protein